MCFKEHYRASTFFFFFGHIFTTEALPNVQEERWKRPLWLTALIPAPAKHYFWKLVCSFIEPGSQPAIKKEPSLWTRPWHRAGVLSLSAAPSGTTCYSAGHSSAQDAQRPQRAQLSMRDVLRQKRSHFSHHHHIIAEVQTLPQSPHLRSEPHSFRGLREEVSSRGAHHRLRILRIETLPPPPKKNKDTILDHSALHISNIHIYLSFESLFWLYSIKR